MQPSDATESFDESQCSALREFVASVRRINDLTVRVGGSVDDLRALTEAASVLEARLAARAMGKPLVRYRLPTTAQGPQNHLLAYSPVTGRYSPFSLPVEVTFEDGKLLGTSTFTEAFEGPPSSVHGGIISSTFDQLLAMANMLGGHGGFTASLTIHYRRTTPLDVPLAWAAWTESVEGRKIRARGTCHADGVLVSEAEGLFIRATPDAQSVPSST